MDNSKPFCPPILISTEVEPEVMLGNHDTMISIPAIVTHTYKLDEERRNLLLKIMEKYSPGQKFDPVIIAGYAIAHQILKKNTYTSSEQNTLNELREWYIKIKKDECIDTN